MLAKVVADPHGVMVSLPYLMVGVGCGVLMVSFVLMDVALPVVLLLVAAYLVPVAVFALCFNKYQKEM